MNQITSEMQQQSRDLSTVNTQALRHLETAKELEEQNAKLVERNEKIVSENQKLQIQLQAALDLFTAVNESRETIAADMKEKFALQLLHKDQEIADLKKQLEKKSITEQTRLSRMNAAIQQDLSARRSDRERVQAETRDMRMMVFELISKLNGCKTNRPAGTEIDVSDMSTGQGYIELDFTHTLCRELGYINTDLAQFAKKVVFLEDWDLYTCVEFFREMLDKSTLIKAGKTLEEIFEAACRSERVREEDVGVCFFEAAKYEDPPLRHGLIDQIGDSREDYCNCGLSSVVKQEDGWCLTITKVNDHFVMKYDNYGAR